jgi:hypothetical protein
MTPVEHLNDHRSVYSINYVFMQNVVMQNVVMLRVVAPFVGQHK